MANFIEKALDLIYPPKCPVCQDVLPYGKYGFCTECSKKRKLAGVITDEGKSFLEAVAIYKFAFIAPAVYHLKYGGDLATGKTLSRLMWEEAKDILKDWNLDCILPVPLHPKRLKKRGFNQAYILAKDISKELNIPIFPEMVLRCMNTKPMKDLNAFQRQNNLKKAFKIGKNDVKLKTILIVDDVYTTGATTDEISRVLLAHGAGKVYVLTLGSDKEDTYER